METRTGKGESTIFQHAASAAQHYNHLFINNIFLRQKTGSLTKSLTGQHLNALTHTTPHNVIHRNCGKEKYHFQTNGLSNEMFHFDDPDVKKDTEVSFSIHDRLRLFATQHHALHQPVFCDELMLDCPQYMHDHQHDQYIDHYLMHFVSKHMLVTAVLGQQTFIA